MYIYQFRQSARAERTSPDLQICVFSCAVRNDVTLIKAFDWRRWQSLRGRWSAQGLLLLSEGGELLCEVSEEGDSLPIADVGTIKSSQGSANIRLIDQSN